MKRPLFILPALTGLLLSCVASYATDPNDGHGGPAPAPEPEPEPEPGEKDERSKARKFLDALKSKDSHAAENSKLKKDLAAAQKQAESLRQEAEALDGAVEAAEENSQRLAEVEKILGMKPGTIADCDLADIRAAVDAVVQKSAAEDIAKSGVPQKKLPAANQDEKANDYDPEAPWSERQKWIRDNPKLAKERGRQTRPGSN